MAVTSEASTVTNFPLRTFNTGPAFLREVPVKNQQPRKKSAAERLTESRSKFIRRGSQDELEDSRGEENQRNQRDMNKACQIQVTPAHDGTHSHVFRAVPYAYGGVKGPQPAKKNHPRQPPPVPNKPSQPGLTGVRKGGRDRTLEIVEASLVLSAKQSAPIDNGAISPHGAVVSTDSSNSNSPHSGREPLSAGSRVRRLKEQFLSIGSAESESENSLGRVSPTELQKSGSSSSSPHTLKKGSFTSRQKDSGKFEFQDPAEADAIKLGITFSGKPKLPARGHVEAVNPEKSLGTSSEHDQSPTSAAASDNLNEQTRRQMERFKAMHATDAAKEINQERKISKIVLKPPNQVADRKERSSCIDDPSRKISSSLVRPRSHTSKDDSSDQLTDTTFEKGPVSRPQALFHITPVPDKDRKPSEKVIKDGTSQMIFLTSHGESRSEVGMMDQDIKAVTTDDVRRLRRTKEHNVSGKSPEHWGEAEETSKAQRAVLGHAVHHAGDRVLVQVSGSVFPTKHRVSDNAFHARLLPEDSIQQDSRQEVIHRRAKSDLDRSNAVLISTTKEADPVRMRHHSHDDQLQREPLIPVSIQKVSAPLAFFEHAKASPNTVKDFQKKAWAPVNFGQIQDRNDVSTRDVQGSVSHNVRALSPDVSRSQKVDADLQTPWRHTHHQNTPRKILSPENTHAHAKSTVQNFLSGFMTSPGGCKMPVRGTKPDTNRVSENLHPTQLQHDSNGNRIELEFSATKMPSEPASGNTNAAETHWAYQAEVYDEVNSNFYSAVQNVNEPADVPLKAVEVTEVCDDRDPNKRKTSVGREIEADAGHGRRYIKHHDRSKIHMEQSVEGQNSVEGQKPGELDKRRKVSQDSDTSSSRHNRTYLGQKVKDASNAERSRVKKMSLSELLSKESTDQLKRAEVTKSSRDEADPKWSLPPKPDRSHGDDSETDSDVELRQSKVLRVKKPQRRAQTKKEDKALQNLLSRIINPEDELNTIKRGQKIRAPEDPKPKTTRKSSGDAGGSSACGSENDARIDEVFSTQQRPMLRKYNAHIQPNVRKPVLNLNLKRSGNNPQAVKPEDTISPPESLTSPTRPGFLRRRSKSDLGMSPQCSVSSVHSDVEHFFNQMGLNESFFQKPLSPLQFSDEDEVFQQMHEYKHTRDDDGRSFSTENSDNLSQGSKVSEEGLHLAKKLPDTSQSIITKNARVIKWLCQMRKARAASIS